ncbi:2-keto-4-pentenoate hydratase [Microbacterium sp. YY-01]|uniref:2-keto-4-pentenoate hydratase n=1 Tax=Microbacterium sp. YY-01 TaxID=3421634 RepID=UPI003D1698F9
MTNHARILHDAQRGTTEVDAFTHDDTLDLAAAYRVQQQLIELRLAEGEQATGLKLGFTNPAKMRQMGVNHIIAGRITTGMAHADGATVSPAQFIHPRVEPELCFRLARDIAPDENLAAISNAIDGIAVGIEVIDSRYRDFRFTLSDVVADNASASAYAIGPWITPTPALEHSLSNLGVILQIDGVDIDTGSTAAILDNPWRALHAAVIHAREHGIPLRAKDVILAGAATAAHPWHPGTSVRATISQLGSVTLHMSEEA